MAAESAIGIPLDLVAILSPLPADGGPLPGTTSWCPATGRWPAAPTWQLGWPPTAAISLRCNDEEPVDARLEEDWLAGPHQGNVAQAREPG